MKRTISFILLLLAANLSFAQVQEHKGIIGNFSLGYGTARYQSDMQQGSINLGYLFSPNFSLSGGVQVINFSDSDLIYAGPNLLFEYYHGNHFIRPYLGFKLSYNYEIVSDHDLENDLQTGIHAGILLDSKKYRNNGYCFFLSYETIGHDIDQCTHAFLINCQIKAWEY